MAFDITKKVHFFVHKFSLEFRLFYLNQWEKRNLDPNKFASYLEILMSYISFNGYMYMSSDQNSDPTLKKTDPDPNPNFVKAKSGTGFEKLVPIISAALMSSDA